MKILFAFSKATIFVTEYLNVLSQYCTVFPAYINTFQFKTSQNIELLLNIFQPDIIHCNDFESFYAFEKFYKTEKIICSFHSDKIHPEISYSKESILEKSRLSVFYTAKNMISSTNSIGNYACILISEEGIFKTSYKIARTHLFYYYQVLLHDKNEIKNAYNIKNFIKMPFFQNCDKQSYRKIYSDEKSALEKFLKTSISIQKKRKILVITVFSQSFSLTEKYPGIEFISILQFSENGVLFRSECMPYFSKDFDISIFSLFCKNFCKMKPSVNELLRITEKKLYFFGKTKSSQIDIKSYVKSMSAKNG